MQPTKSPPKLNADQILGAARLTVRHFFPYLTKGVYRLRYIPEPACPTLGTSAEGVVYYNPAWIENRGVHGTMVDIMHELVVHVLKAHHKRADKYGVAEDELKLANVCMDAEGNGTLREMIKAAVAELEAKAVAVPENFRMADRVVYAENLPFPVTAIPQLWEGYMNDARAAQPPSSGGPQAPPGGAAGQPGQGTPGDGGQAAQQGAQPAPGGSPNGPAAPEPQGPGAGECGGCAGRRRPWEKAEDGNAENQMERMRRAVAHDIKEHAEAHGAGSMPGSLVRWADSIIKHPPVPWDEVLQNISHRGLEVRRGYLDYTYSRPSPRQGAVFGYGAGVPMLPSFEVPDPALGVVWDTSGSMTNTEGALVKGALDDVLVQTEVPITLITCDAEPEVHRNVTSLAQAERLAAGGGGTKFAPVFEAIEEMPLEQRPAVLIFMTDGGNWDECPLGPPEGVEVIWLLVGMRETPKFRGQPWGTFITVPRHVDQAA